MNALEVRNLTKTYPTGVQALRGIDLTVPAGDFFALLGPNGAGKTTLIGILTSLVRKGGGQVSVFGHDLDRDLSAAKACIGVVPQEINLNLWDRCFNILVNQAGFYGLPRARARQRAEECLQRLQLWDKRNATARSLSGGMKRRLMIARALMHEPKLLILDEPTAGVDIEIRRSMWQFLREVNAAGTTIILTTHYLEEAENLCRHVAIIDHGRVIEDAPMAAVLRKLQQETFVLTLAAPASRLPAIPGFDLQPGDDLTLEVAVPRDRSVNELFAGLSAAGLEVVSLRNKANRLEELFVRLTERKPGGQAAPAAVRQPGVGRASAGADAA
jgi:ABC-2 type transport system ATP-binding protein